MFKTDKVVFKKLNKMPITRRIEVASSPQGSSILAALTPTQFAELFPRHYQRGLPDVGGFRAATTAAAQKRQSEVSASILDRLTKAEQGAEAYASQIYHKLKRKLGLETTKLPELSPEQAAAFDKVRSGPIAVNSDEGKVFSRLDDKKLESVGITRTKDNTGRDVYQYSQPGVDRSEAESKLKSGGTGSNRFFDSIIRAEGTGKHGDPYNTSLGYMKSPKPLTEMTMAESLAWGDQVRKAQGMNSSAKGAFQIVNTTQLNAMKSLGIGMDEKFSPENQRRMAAWIVKQQGLGAWEGFKVHPDEKQNAVAAMQEGLHTQFTSAIKPEGPNGSYSDAQINKMMDQLREEKNATRKQQLANLLSDAGVSTATINSISEIKTSGVTGQHFGEGVQCVALSKHFAPQIGPASKWQFNEGTAGIVPGAVIATRRYADGSGGKMASQMPDGRSHYHTGIALTRPDAQGNVLIFDQAKAYGSKISRVNINDYHGETWGVVKGGEPTPRSMEAVNMALSRANDSEKAAITESMRGSTPKVATSTGEVKANVDVGPVPTKPVNQEGDPLPPQQVSTKQPGAPQESAPQVKADAPPPAPKIQPTRYKFNEQTFLQEVRAKSFGAGLVSDEYIMGETLKGFKDTPGVKYDRKTGTLTIDDPNSPAIKEIVSKMRENNLDEKVFLNKMKEEKPTPPPETKPKEQKPVAPPPEKKAEAPPPPPQAQAAAPEKPKVEAQPVQEPPKVPGASNGGLFDVGDRNIGFYPMDKRDNVAAVDTRTQQPLFTARTGENVSMDQQGRVDVSPSQKVGGIAPAQDTVRNEIETLRREIGSSFSDAGNITSPPQIRQLESSRNDNPNFVDRMTKLNADQWNNKVMERAMNRTRLQETGDSLNNHFSYGNTNS